MQIRMNFPRDSYGLDWPRKSWLKRFFFSVVVMTITWKNKKAKMRETKCYVYCYRNVLVLYCR